MSYFHVKTSHPYPLKVNRDWLCSNPERICPSCFSVIGSGALDVVVDRIEDTQLNICVPVGLGVVRLDLMSGLGEELFRGKMHVGEVYLATGRRVADFFTFRAALPVRICGSENSLERHCEKCSSELYYPRGDWFVRASDLGGREICESNFCQLLLRDDILARLDEDEIQQLNVMKLPEKP